MGSRPVWWAHYCATLTFIAVGSSCLGVDPAQAGPQVHPQRWPRLQAPLPPDADLERRLDVLLAHMTPEQKVGQLIQADIGSVTPADVRELALGSVLNGGNSSPRDDKLAAPGEWLALADRFYAASAGGDAVVPVLWGTDAVHGHNNLPGATTFPHNIGLGARRDPELIRRWCANTRPPWSRDCRGCRGRRSSWTPRTSSPHPSTSWVTGVRAARTRAITAPAKAHCAIWMPPATRPRSAPAHRPSWLRTRAGGA